MTLRRTRGYGHYARGNPGERRWASQKKKCPLLQCLLTTSAILAGTHSYFVVSFKCEGKNSCHDLIPNLCIYKHTNKSDCSQINCKKKSVRATLDEASSTYVKLFFS